MKKPIRYASGWCIYIGATQSSAGIELCWEAAELLANPLISETRLALSW